MEQWRRESEHAEFLLEMAPFNDREREMISKVSHDQNFKITAMLVLGFTFGLSLKRYFPGMLLTENNRLFVLTTLAIMAPCYALGKLHTNREVITRLSILEENHQILNAKLRESE